MAQNRYESTSTHSFSLTVASYGILTPNHVVRNTPLGDYKLFFEKNPGIFGEKVKNQPHTLAKMGQNGPKSTDFGDFWPLDVKVGPKLTFLGVKHTLW